MATDSPEPTRLPVAAPPGTGFDALLDRLGIPVQAVPSPEGFVLAATQGVLELRPPGEAHRPGIRAAFPPDADRAGRGTGGRVHPLVRAFGAADLSILDLTAGLGADAYRLAAAGHRVCAAERDPVVFALLVTAWEEACRAGRVAPAIAARLDFVHADAVSLLASLELADAGARFGAGGPVGVYLDPMYPPPRKASALPRRELQVLRRLIGASDGVETLLARARAAAARVVLKRPHHAPALASGASFVVESKLVRFDVYLDPSRMGTKPA
jgi:16S rRNA (guanine1516-N2)-methyltransferase